MNHCRQNRGFAWLELLLAIAAMALALQLWPEAGYAAWRVLDFRQWSSVTWMILNAVVLLGLISARFIPSALAAWRERRFQPAEKTRAQQREQEARQRKERREAVQRAKQARRSRLY